MLDFTKPGRMLSLSKSAYQARYPGHHVVFNANICSKEACKIWHGDLDLTLEATAIQSFANMRNETLYVLKEHDARFSNEKTPLFDRAVMVVHPQT